MITEHRLEPPSAKSSEPRWTDEHKSRVRSYVEFWAPILFLDHHHINIVFAESHTDSDDKCAADATDNHPYESGHRIVFYPDFLEFADDELAKRAALHEMTHIITGLSKTTFRAVIVKERYVPWREVVNIDERMTDWIANIVFELATSGVRNGAAGGGPSTANP